MVLSKLKSLLSVLEFKGAISAALLWKKFSLASFLIVSRLKRDGVSPCTVIDLGANIGQFAIAATNIFKNIHIISIEPDPKTAKTLERNLYGVDSAEVLSFAISDYIGEDQLFINKDSQVSSMLSLGSDRIREFPQSIVVDTITVPVATLDSLFLDRKLEKPILIKIDVQGLEDKVIRGGKGLLKDVKWIVIEVSFSDLYEGESDFTGIIELMSRNNFKFVRPMNFHVSPVNKQIMEMDALFSKSNYIEEL